MNRLLRFILVFAALFVVETIVCANNVSAQAKPAQAANEFLMATAVGDLAVHATPNTARIHLNRRAISRLKTARTFILGVNIPVFFFHILHIGSLEYLPARKLVLFLRGGLR